MLFNCAELKFMALTLDSVPALEHILTYLRALIRLELRESLVPRKHNFTAPCVSSHLIYFPEKAVGNIVMFS